MISMSEQDAAVAPEQAPEGEDVTAEATADVQAETTPAVQAEPDAALLSRASREQARAALEEITDPKSIGGEAGHEVHDERTVTLFFECTLAGYPNWRWAAAIARVDAESPVTVLEVELLPGEGAMLAPEWVPWSERLAQYRDAQARQRQDSAAQLEDADDLDDIDDLDESDDEALENDYSDFDDVLDGVELDEDIDADDADDPDDAADDDEYDDESDGEQDDSDSDDDGDDEAAEASDRDTADDDATRSGSGRGRQRSNGQQRGRRRKPASFLVELTAMNESPQV